jgi:hypothetical protein
MERASSNDSVKENISNYESLKKIIKDQIKVSYRLIFSCLKGVIKESDRFFLFSASFCVMNLLKTEESGWNAGPK